MVIKYSNVCFILINTAKNAVVGIVIIIIRGKLGVW